MKELRTKNEADLKKVIAENREALRQFRFNEAGSRTRNVKAALGLRKGIARALTELASRRARA